MKTRSLMVQGTGSGAGKSLIAAAFCRIFSDKGMNVAPFKAQNMALNSYITIDGGEIGRAQALQAEASRTAATIDMNPVLLKASGEAGCQVIIHGKVHAMMKAKEYYGFKKEAWKAVTSAYDRLSGRHDLIIMEGAGSPAEINLMNVDIVNMSAAKYAKAPVLLVGDIDKGGVFASIYGTVRLLGRDSRHIKGFIINKFRGDPDILKPGLEMIRERTGKPVAGVLPYIKDLGLPEEDGLVFERLKPFESMEEFRRIRIVVLRLKYISNFTDFDPLACEPDVELIYSGNPADIENADLVIIPGSKNTVRDLLSLRECGLDRSVNRAFAKGIKIVGICGGYQMLGKKIYDPQGIESPHKEVEGLGLLDIETSFEAGKTTCRVEAEIADSAWLAHTTKNNPGNQLQGYEIHMGVSIGDIGLFKLKRRMGEWENRRENVTDPPFHRVPDSEVLDGSKNNNCWGTYIHGIFENNAFRRNLLNRIRSGKGFEPLPVSVDYIGIKEKALDRLAEIVRSNIDMSFVERILDL
jgi:adenosylcobyric acid synthase